MKRLAWLQSLRGVAAVSVLFFHMRLHWETVSWLAPLSALTKWGAVGVDLFITLSGFVVCYATFSGSREVSANAWPFLMKRAIRIYSGYWIALAFGVSSTIFLFPGVSYPAEKAFRSIFLLYPYFMDGWLPVAWTLAFELYFYAWVALALWLRPKNLVVWILALLSFLIVWNVGWMTISPQLVYEQQQPTRFFIPAFGIEFLFGALLALDFRRRENFSGYAPGGILLACIGCVFGTYSYDMLHFELLRALSFGTASVGVIMFCLWLEQSGGLAPPRLLLAIGDASYSLYLLHPFLLDDSSLVRAWLYQRGPILLAPFALAMPVLIIAFSLGWYRMFEHPLYRFLSGYLNRSETVRRPLQAGHI